MIKELLIILFINYLAFITTKFISIPIPEAIAGMTILFLLLYFKILKVSSIENVSTFLTTNISLFIAFSAVKIIETFHLLMGDMFKIVVLIVVTTLITMGITGKIVQILIARKEKG